jgi:hypothetical protein
MYDNQQELTMILLTNATNTQTALQPQHASIFLKRLCHYYDKKCQCLVPCKIATAIRMTSLLLIVSRQVIKWHCQFFVCITIYGDKIQSALLLEPFQLESCAPTGTLSQVLATGIFPSWACST